MLDSNDTDDNTGDDGNGSSTVLDRGRIFESKIDSLFVGYVFGPLSNASIVPGPMMNFVGGPENLDGSLTWS